MKENQTSYPYFEWIPLVMKDVNEEVTSNKEKKNQKTLKTKRKVLLCSFLRWKAVCIKSTTFGILLEKTFLLTITNQKELVLKKKLQSYSYSPHSFLFYFRTAFSSIHLMPL